VEQYEAATVAQLTAFDEIIDVRSPGEYADDRIPGAINCPVLDDDERARVGTIYKQVSPFEAKRVGAAIVARNIAAHIERRFFDRPRHWHPLIYCWRGGSRSDAMCHVLRRVGWRAGRLDGGYRAYRRAVVDALASLPDRWRFIAICGRTGCGKSRVLGALQRFGAQVLDLEAIAHHRGSVLGEIPGLAQPSQRMFESVLWDAMQKLDPLRPVFVEAESRKVGNVQVPPALIAAIRQGACINLEAPEDVRVEILMQEYEHFLYDADVLRERLLALRTHSSDTTLNTWIDRAAKGEHRALVADLLTQHYDPAYDRSIHRNFARIDAAPTIVVGSAHRDASDDAARRILAAMPESTASQAPCALR
jgi:tRNA 2-selenouridine synthase